MLIRAGDDFLEMVATYRTHNLYTKFEIKVQSFGFTGQGTATIDALILRSFDEQLRELENKRQGKAELSSISPREFWLKICSIDGLGHMGLFGRFCRFEIGLGHEHLLEFGFGFDPSLLPTIVKHFEAIAREHL